VTEGTAPGAGEQRSTEDTYLLTFLEAAHGLRWARSVRSGLCGIEMQRGGERSPKTGPQSGGARLRLGPVPRLALTNAAGGDSDLRSLPFFVERGTIVASAAAAYFDSAVRASTQFAAPYEPRSPPDEVRIGVHRSGEGGARSGAQAGEHLNQRGRNREPLHCRFFGFGIVTAVDRNLAAELVAFQ
jgi:hypothetical protein